MSKVLTDFSTVAYYTFDDSETVTLSATKVTTARFTLHDFNATNAILWTGVTDVPIDFEYSKYTYSAQGGWVRNTTLANAKKDVKTAIRQRRLVAEEAGITVNGRTVDTTRENQNLIVKIQNTVAAGAIGSIYYYHADGTYELLDNTAATNLARSVMAWVQKVALNERNHCVNVDALTTVTAVYAYDYSVGWMQTSVNIDDTTNTIDSTSVTIDAL